jgi:hypothetical protein
MPNTGFSGAPPLPRREDDRAPRTPSAAVRREAFARRHPEILISARREGTCLVFEVTEPGRQVAVHHDAGAMMDDLEARYPRRMAETSGPAASPVIRAWARHHSLTQQLAARLARELALRPDHSRVESSMKIAARHGVSNTMAVNARNLLMGARLIYKSGRHYYKAALPHNRNGTEG